MKPARFPVAFALLVAASVAEADERIPEPLSLQQALVIGASHPTLDSLQRGIDEAGSESGEVNPDDATLPGSLARPPHDSGCIDALRDHSRARNRADQLRLERERRRFSLRIARRFFNVLLADRHFARDDESMAIAFVTLERIRERNQIGQVSDLEALRAEQHFAEALLNRSESDHARRLSRLRLAEAMGRPGELASDLAEPELTGLEEDIPGVAALTEAAMTFNPKLRWLRAEVAAAEAVRAAARHSRVARNPPRGPGFSVPVPAAGCDGLEPATLGSAVLWQRKELRDAESEIRESVATVWHRVARKRLELEASVRRLDYRELYLDRSRAVYELGLRTDLGDAMIQITDADARHASARYDLALARWRLEALTGLDLSAGARESGG